MNSWKKTLSESMEYLNPIGKFISTYGLAVFLVLYYTLFIYPGVVAERQDWIDTINKLEKSIDPEERPFSKTHSEIILDYVNELYFSSILSKIPISELNVMGARGGISYISPSVTNKNYYNKSSYVKTIKTGMIEWYIDETDNIDPQLDELIRRIQDEAERLSKNNISKIFSDNLEVAISEAAYSSERLRVFNFGDSTLYQVWSNTIKSNEAILKQRLINSLQVNEYNNALHLISVDINQQGYNLEFDYKEYESPLSILNKYKADYRTNYITSLTLEKKQND